MTCGRTPRRTLFQVSMALLVVALLVYAFRTGNYSVGAASVVPALLFVYAECGDLPLLGCEVGEEVKVEFKR